MLPLYFDSCVRHDFFSQTISDTVNDLLKMEEEWKKNGYNVTEVPTFT